MKSRLRLFIALPVPAAAREELRRAQAELREDNGNSMRWTRPEQIHLTLRFLGNVESGRVAELTEAVRGVCQGFAPLRLRAEGIGFFPERGLPRVVWTAVEGEGNKLKLLQAAINRAVTRFAGHAEEKEFAGHLTIGRAKGISPAQSRVLAEAARAMSGRVFGEWTANTVEIIQSELSSEGSRYVTLASLSLCRK